AIVDAFGQCTYVNEHGRLLLGTATDREAAGLVTAACQGQEGGSWSEWPNLQIREVPLDTAGAQRVITFRDVSELRVSQERLEAMSRAVARVAESGSLNETLSAVASEVKETLNLAAVNIVMLGSAAGQPRYLVGGAGFGEPPDEGARGMRRAEALGAEFKYLEAMETGRLVVVPHRKEEILKDPRWASAHDGLRALDWDGFVAAPLVARGRIIGSLSAFYPPEVEPDADEVSLFTIMADQAALAVDNAGLLAQTKRKAATQERSRLARELHDSIVQDVFSLAVHARTIQVSAEQGGPQAEERIRAGAADLMELSRSALTSLRALIFELRPPALADHSVLDAVRAYAASMSRRSGIPIDVVDERAETSLSEVASEHVYRVVQEALHNAVRHAHPTHVTVRFSMSDELEGELLVEIVDDGTGFVVDRVGPDHLGLETMRERAEAIEGTLEVKSSPGAGTRVTLRAPWSAPEPPARTVG
ncbi:MAG: GAF domain-containing sensor histidine kinase, partial [Acidimicrobiaceae bacterium]|nr:GAF domain-containing sensor histidine kinase [Acidimicrobiaceae bacterium]